MKALYLLRHAKSSWDNPSLADLERPLSKRGLKAASLIGKVMGKQGVKVDVVLCSSAVRTRETVKLALKAAGLKQEVSYRAKLYAASADELANEISGLKDSVASVLLVGHNPGLADLLYDLCGTVEHFPTAALARLTLQISRWGELRQGCGSLDWLIRPREVSTG